MRANEIGWKTLQLGEKCSNGFGLSPESNFQLAETLNNLKNKSKI